MTYYKAKNDLFITNNKKWYFDIIKNGLYTITEYEKLKNKIDKNCFIYNKYQNNFDIIELSKNKTFICFGLRQQKQL